MGAPLISSNPAKRGLQGLALCWLHSGLRFG